MSSLSVTSTPPHLRKQVVYLVRHAEATHNIKEREAVQAAIARGCPCPDKARKAVLQDETLLDAPLSPDGQSQVLKASQRLNQLFHNSGNDDGYPPPAIILVSPLRRVLMTATELFGADNNKFVALEALREKRTGYAADERMPVEVLEQEFPHVDFSNLKTASSPEKGETNELVRERSRQFLEHYLSAVPEESVAIVTHKGWLRELRKMLKERVDEGTVQVDFDVGEQWYQTLYGNAEIRVAEFGWNTEQQQLTRIVSKSVENALLLRCSSTSATGGDGEQPNSHLSKKNKKGGNNSLLPPQ